MKIRRRLVTLSPCHLVTLSPRILVALLLLAGVPAGAQSFGNRVPNGDISAMEGSKPGQGWSTYVAGGEAPDFTVEDEGGARGKVLRVEAKDGKRRGFWVTAAFPVRAGERITFSLNARCELQSGGAAVGLGFRGADGRAMDLRSFASLAGRSEWRLQAATMVVPAGAQTAYMTLGVANGTVGSVWGDDFAAAPCPLRVGAARLGLRGPRSARVLQFNLDPVAEAPRQATAQLEIASEAGLPERMEQSIQFEGKRRSIARFESARMEGFRGRLLVRAAEGTLLAAEEFQAPPILQTGLTDARYRHTLFTRPGSPQILRGTIHIECLPEAVRRLSLAIRLLPLKGDSPLAEQKPRVEKTEIPFALDVTALRPDRFRLLVSLSAGSSEIASEMVPLTFREDNVGIVRVDGNNNLVVGGEPFFPYGVYGGVPADELPRIKAAGCNMVLTYDSNPDSLRTLLAKAQEVGLRVVVAAPSPFVGKLPAEADNLREVVRSLRRAPALLGWYLDDEPDGKGTDPALVRAVHDVVVEEDPDHPTWVVFDHPAVYDRYADVCDVFMVDPYPILDKRQPLTKVADWIETARRAVADGKPVIGVPQAFGWEIIKNVPKANYVTPTAEEYRAMVYLSLAHGAKGLVAYCYHVYTEHDAAKSWPWVLGGYLPDKQPKLWDEMTRLAGEVKALTPALLSADREPLSIAQFGDAAEHGVRLRAGGKEVTILVNPGEQPLPLTRAARVMGSALFLAPGTPAAPAGETLPRYGVLVTEAPAR